MKSFLFLFFCFKDAVIKVSSIKVPYINILQSPHDLHSTLNSPTYKNYSLSLCFFHSNILKLYILSVNRLINHSVCVIVKIVYNIIQIVRRRIRTNSHFIITGTCVTMVSLC